MKCQRCDHESADKQPKFCSMCGNPMRTLVPTKAIVQEDANMNLVPQTEVELEPGKELVSGETIIPGCSDRIWTDEPQSLGSTGPPNKKRKKRRKKKKESSNEKEFMSLPASLEEEQHDECPSDESESITTSLEGVFHHKDGGNLVTLSKKSDSEMKDSEQITKVVQESSEAAKPKPELQDGKKDLEENDGAQGPSSKEPVQKVTKVTDAQVISGNTVLLEKLKESECHHKSKLDDKQSTAKSDKVTSMTSRTNDDHKDSESKDNVIDLVSGDDSQDRSTGPNAQGYDKTTSSVDSKNDTKHKVPDQVRANGSQDRSTDPDTQRNDATTSIEDSENKDTKHKAPDQVRANGSQDRSTGPDTQRNDATTSIEDSENKDTKHKAPDQVSADGSQDISRGPVSRSNDKNTNSEDSENKDTKHKTLDQVKGTTYTRLDESKSKLTEERDNINSNKKNVDSTKPSANLGKNSSPKMPVAAQKVDIQMKKEKETPRTSASEKDNTPKNDAGKTLKQAEGQDIKNDHNNKSDKNDQKTKPQSKKDRDDQRNEESKKEAESIERKGAKKKTAENTAQKKLESEKLTSQPIQPVEETEQNLQQNEEESKGSSNEDIDTNAAAVARERDQKNYITIYFHVVVSKDFGLKLDNDKVIVRGNLEGYKAWKSTVCELDRTKEVKDLGFLYEGHTLVSKNNLDKYIPYKYVVVRGNGDVHYEYIYCETHEKSHVNRCLHIPSMYALKGEWHQYDDVCLKKKDSFLKRFQHLWTDKYKSICEDKRKASEVILSSIYSILGTCDEINLSSFFQQLQQFYFVITRSLVFADTVFRWHVDVYDKDKVKDLMMTLLNKICDPFIKKNAQKSDVKLNRIEAGLICLWIAKFSSIHINKEHLTNICCVLCLDEIPREKLIGELQQAKTLFSNVPGIHELIKQLCQQCIDENVDQWVWILPVLHTFAISNTEKAMSVQEDVWAGLEGLVYAKSFRDVLGKMSKKKYLLQSHPVVIQSWLCLISLEQMVKFLEEHPVPIVAVLTACYFKIPGANYYENEKVEEVLRKILQIMETQGKPLKSESFQKCCKASLDLHYIILSNRVLKVYFGLPALSAEIILMLLKYAGFSTGSDESESLQPEMKKVFDNAMSLTLKWLEDVFGDKFTFSYHRTKHFPLEMKAWNMILKAGENVTQWKECLLPLLRKKIKQEEPIKQIMIYCKEQNQFKDLHPSINKCFEDCAIEAVHLACQSENNILTKLDTYNLTNFGQLVSSIILNSWPKDNNGKCVTDNDEILQHLLQWEDATYIFKLYGTDSRIIQHIGEEIQELVVLSESVFLEAKERVMDGAVQLKHLECIMNNRKKFLDICKLKVEKKENFLLADIMEVLQWRQKELKMLKNDREWVGSLLQTIRRMNPRVIVDISEVQKKYSQNLGPQRLKDLMSVKTLAKDVDGDPVSYYNLSPEIMEMAYHVHTFRNSHVFITCLEQQEKLFANSFENLDNESEAEEVYEITLEELKDKLYIPCLELCKIIYNNLKTGEVTFEVVDKFLKDFKNQYKQLEGEFKYLCHLGHNDSGRWISQRVKQIEQYHQLDLAFRSAAVIDEVKTMLNLSGNFQTLTTLLEFADNFENCKQKPLSCISDEVMKTRKLLSEIKDEHIVCLKEVLLGKDFFLWVKEALEDVNELKVFVDLASISAGENDMDVDRVACFHDAVLGYSSLLYELDSHSGFDDLMKCLEKLWNALQSDVNLPKKMRDSARHVEWLKTVKESHGSVELSSLSLATSINKRGTYIIQAPQDNKKIALDNVIQLNLIEEGDGINNRVYTLEELKELLNKLMLMSAKGDQSNEEVEKFSEIFTNVQRLARSFIDLYLAGNMLFRTWKVEIYCSEDAPIGIFMIFGVKGIDELEGEGPLTSLLPDICRTMENLLDHWLEFMKKKRSQHYYLNYYTAEQLVFLSQEFQNEDISEEALVMLSFIKPHCQQTDTSKTGDSSIGKRPNKMNFAFKFATCTNILEKLRVVWEYSMAHMNSLFPGCLDLDALGTRLASLAEQNKKWVLRKLHPSLHEGRPNLVLCPSSQILSCALAMYMHSATEPLPSYDEVLLCTPQTSFEEVTLFFRRCVTPGYNGKKIYSLIYADELNYDTAYKSEQLFQQLQAGNDDYCLVVICNSDREHCYIPSVFSQHKVHMIPQNPLDEIQRYLRTHFAVDAGIDSAAHVFQNGLSAGIVASKRAGMGKSLYVERLYEELESSFEEPLLKTIRLINPEVDENKVLNALLPFLDRNLQNCPIIFHIDITSSVNKGIPEFMFKLLVLQYLMDSKGRIWKRLPNHLYIVEILESANLIFTKQYKSAPQGVQHNFIDFFPKILCCSPNEVLTKYTEDVADVSEDPGMDVEEFRSECFQRPYQYLTRFDMGQNLDTFTYAYDSVEGDPAKCLQIFLLHCGIIDPSWSELRNFAWFLNIQLKDCESSDFCKFELVGDLLPGFKRFVVDFMIIMAKDFATPSLDITDQSPGGQILNRDECKEKDLAPFVMRKRWETEPHPYIFFNNDRASMTFIGFHLQPNNAGGVDAINPKDNTVIKKNVMTMQLYNGLVLQRVPFNIDFDKLPRDEKISRLCMVLGIEWPFDPDETYELTTDNILKILAIKMRFRCGIPVVIMGETGCGKTRLIKFLCHLCKGFVTENMKLVKVHGGTTAEMIYQKILEAQEFALLNKANECDTVLFFDEANTTEAISSIKEALCDHTVDGEPLEEDSGLHIIAACNPYRKHTDEMIKRLESAGLGYRVSADETKERLGSIPLRQLVYRVHALPPSMMPLVWDFGQLNDETEKQYIQQIVQRLAKEIQLSTSDVQMLTDVLSASQTHMRLKNDECSFVSLRDVERCIEVFKWFYNHHEKLLKNQKNMLKGKVNTINRKDKVPWSLVLAVGVCYHASLERKDLYRKAICKHFPQPYKDQAAILHEISVIQDLFLSGVHLRDTIARNLALKENLFMMVICIELKIPLFLVGKPGSSKSLAKTIVADAMQGQAAHTELYKDLKQIHLVSFQCSPHSTPEGIIGTFKQCARFQEGKNLTDYVSVVVLDEIGLAEDSAKMPLKTLHPLLEDGCIDDDPLPHKKVGFIGISNWALDPAKMNRGIFVSRGDPNVQELIESAQGICSSDQLILKKVSKYFQYFAGAYEQVCETQKEQKKEFFGLRDFYSLIKMVFAFTKQSEGVLTEHQIARAVLRNFSGKDDLNALEIFVGDEHKQLGEACNTIDLVLENIKNDSEDLESRYLLILTKNYAALQILQQVFLKENQQPEIIFGSSFPKDQEYTQICRNINRVKICMETGQMVILLNLQNLYESLYDALNQYYVYLAGQKYVDLGLGTHRVKCRVHPKFRLIVIEEKDIVYKDFPIPLINRLEKHYLDISTFLKREHMGIVQELENWVQMFTKANVEHLMVKDHEYSPSDVFIGYHSDTCASVVLQVMENMNQTQSDPEDLRNVNVKKKARCVLLNCATPDSVIRSGTQELIDEYFKLQHHGSFLDFLSSHITAEYGNHAIFTEITTFSRLLTSVDKKILEAQLQSKIRNIEILSLQQFDTEYSFLKKIRSFLESSSGNLILIIQTDFEEGSQGANLVASAKYSAVNEINKLILHEKYVFVYFITKLPRIKGGTSYVGFRGGLWQSVHIDDLRISKDMVTDVTGLLKFTISQLFHNAAPETKESARDGENKTLTEVTAMEVEDSVPDESKEHESDQLDDINFMEIYRGVDEEMVTEFDQDHEKETDTASNTFGNMLDTTTLIRSCVQNAIGLLRDEENINSRSTRRIEILINLLNTESDLKDSFLKCLKDRLHNMLRSQEEDSFHAVDWVLREAANLDALQEAGTFRQTLWKRVQTAVTPFLSHILAIIDCNGNMEILVDEHVEDFIKSLWMFIFSDKKLLPVSSNFSSQTETILVKNNMNIAAFGQNCLPFSWRIKDYLEEIWTQAQHIDCLEGPEMKFVNIFSQTPLGTYISSKEIDEQENLFLNYQRDFILMNMTVSSPRELKVMEHALSTCIQEIRVNKGSEQLTLPWVHIGYNTFQHRLQNLSRILALSPSVLTSLEKQIDDRNPMITDQMALDIFAAIACLEILKDSVKSLRPQTWMCQVKDMQMPIELICSEEYLKDYSPRCKPGINQIRSDWNCVFSMALFMEHMLVDEFLLDQDMKQIIIRHTRALGQCLENFRDIKSQKPFWAVVKVLRKCREEVSRSVSRFGMQTCAICQGDPSEPVCLPCNHIFCRDCISDWLKTSHRSCPVCIAPLPDDFTIVVSDEIRKSIGKNVQFRKLCNGFFVDIICTMCFKDNTPPDKEVIEHLLSLLFGNIELRHYTRSLTPFEDAVDKTPVLRSIILKLLLKYSFTDIMGYAQEYFTAVERNNLLAVLDATEVYLLFVNSLEDSLFERQQRLQSDPLDNGKYLEIEGTFLEHYVYGRKNQNTNTVQFLQNVARLRLALNTAAELLPDRSEGFVNENFLDCVKKLCSSSGNDWYRIYLIRKLANLYGIDTVQRHFKDPEFGWLFPKGMRQNKDTQTSQIDQFLVCGDNYKVLRDGIGRAMIEGKKKLVEKAIKECKIPDHVLAVNILLAVFREITLCYGVKNNPDSGTAAEHEAIKKFIRNLKFLQEDATSKFVETLLNNTRPALHGAPGMRGSQVTVCGLATHMAAVLLNSNDRLFSPLRNLSLFPTRMQNSYLPTMPEDMMVYARTAMQEQLQWYRCPNGHYCTIGECGRPVQVGQCLDCGAPVGGMNYVPQQGFHLVQNNEDRTQTGHVLGLPEQQGAAIAPDRDLPAPEFILLRLVTHLAMLLGSEEDVQSVQRIVKPQVPDVRRFLFGHIAKDLEYLKNTLGKSADDTTTIVHLVLCRMLDPHQQGQWPVQFDEIWSTKEMRSNWEKHFAAAVIAPVLKSLDKDLMVVNNYISKDERISSNPIVRIVYGDPLKSGEKLELPQNSPADCSKIWSCRERISIEYLMHIVQQKDGKKNLPLFWKFLEKEPELKMVKFLPEILRLQKELVKRFQNFGDVVHETIQDFLSSTQAGAHKLMKKRIEDFLLTWNNLRHSLQTKGEIKLPGDMCDNPLTMDSKFTYLLPRRQGDGLCATALVSYLITLHNRFIYALEKYTKNEQKYIIKTSDVTDLHVISYDMEKDFMPIILSNCQYTLESGKETLQEFDLPKIQHQVAMRFFQGKPLITMHGLPTIISTQDRNYENLFIDIRKKLEQISLPNSAIDFISKDLGTFSDVCEALNIVDVALGFLAMSGGDPELLITTYIEDTLQMKEQSSVHVLEALKRCYLKNTIALWQLLTALKSAHLLHLKRDPFADVDQAYKMELDKEGQQQLNIFLEQHGTNVFLFELHEMIALKLKKKHSTEELKPAWTLREVLGPLLDEKDLSFPEMETDFPEQIALAHCISTWKFAAAKKWGRL
ncbi:E3 ubiquitin-protein ligase RNF213-like isoform X2 [Engystomops pustulosus]|uniref:E3 ubiquitin-protein ligase RNF213-like isoform X2 n=1 Tax=Engystomops pustulosus TaxID=76066 RepID=UPI003AFA288F